MARLNLPRKRYFEGPAPHWKRLVAFIVDFIIINLVIFTPFKKLFTKIIPIGDFTAVQAALTSNETLSNTILVMLTFIGVLALLYFAILEYKFGMTIGKRLLRIEVKTKKQLRFWQCIVRSLFCIPLFPFPILWVLDPVYMLFTKDNTRLLERLSKTQTVERMVMQ